MPRIGRQPVRSWRVQIIAVAWTQPSSEVRGALELLG